MKNEFTLSEDGKTSYIKLTQGQVAIIDAEDLEKIADYRWSVAWVGKGKNIMYELTFLLQKAQSASNAY
jgi:hypothetical protein